MTRFETVPTPRGVDVINNRISRAGTSAASTSRARQCDDCAGVTVRGVGGVGATSDCGGNANIFRGDVRRCVDQEDQACPSGRTSEAVAIVIMFDEARPSWVQLCCGWVTRRASAWSNRHQQWRRLERRRSSLRAREQRAWGQHLRRADEPTRRAEGRRRQRCVQPCVVRADAAGHVRPRGSGRRLVLHEPVEVNRAVHQREPRSPPGIRGQRRSAFRCGAAANHAFVIPNGYVQKNGFPVQQVGRTQIKSTSGRSSGLCSAARGCGVRPAHAEGCRARRLRRARGAR